MNHAENRASSVSLPGSSAQLSSWTAVSQRGQELASIGSEVIDWLDDFLPAIPSNTVSPGVVRLPEWYALRYVSGREKLLFWLLGRIGLTHQWLSFSHRVKRRTKPIRKAWLPGIVFCNFDRRVDRWQQVLRMPHVISYYGAPTAIPIEVFDDLVKRCPERLDRPTAFSSVAPGTTIRIIRGPKAGLKAVVSWSDRKFVKVPMLMFGREGMEVTLKASDVEVVKE